MNCMRCGREINEAQVFCPDCLADMEKYPVKPGTAVHLPRRTEPPLSRRILAKRRTSTPEEQLKKMRKLVRRLMIVLIIAVALIAALAYPAVEHLLEGREFLIGQNYSAMEESDATEPADSP